MAFLVASATELLGEKIAGFRVKFGVVDCSTKNAPVVGVVEFGCGGLANLTVLRLRRSPAIQSVSQADRSTTVVVRSVACQPARNPWYPVPLRYVTLGLNFCFP
jgi:hypothetical protein